MIKRHCRTDFLFSTPDFWVAAGSVINLAGSYYSFNTSASGAEADNKALENDFCVIAEDFNKACGSMKLEVSHVKNLDSLICEG